VTKLRSTHLLMAATAAVALAGGAAFLLAIKPDRSPGPAIAQAPTKIEVAPAPGRERPARSALFGLRSAIEPSGTPRAPETAAAPPAVVSGLAVVSTARPFGAPEGIDATVSFPPTAEPPATPRPPKRPTNLAELAAANPDAAASITSPAAPGQETTEVPSPGGAPLVEAPLPASRPRDATGAGQEVASLQEPALRPAPEDAFQQPPPKLGMGDPVFVRIFKQEGQLELWLKKEGRFHLYKTFPICKWSGRLGPKQKEADYQSPEGFYSVSARQLNPHSNYHRAFNVGYPNAFDKQNGRTGGLVMVHGACKSVGCFAMTDRGIEEIYGFVEAALRAGQKDVPVHIFPFRLTEANIARETGGGWLAFVSGPAYAQWGGFWKNLKEGYDLFEQSGEPPTAFACGDHYEFGAGAKTCRRIAGW
jgi:murein L,D-transpeptidase YafK